MRRPSSTLAPWLAIALLALQALAPLAHLAAHASKHRHCARACLAPQHDGGQLVHAEPDAHPCTTCLMIARVMGAMNAWAPEKAAHVAEAHRTLTAAEANHPSFFDFNISAARGPPAYSPTAV